MPTTLTKPKPKPKPKHQQVAAARKAAALKASNTAARQAYPTLLQVENMKARIAAAAYIKEQQDQQSDRLLSKAQVLARVCVTFPTLWKMVRQGHFPQPRFVLNKTLWIEREVDKWMENLPVREYKEVSKKV